jgi:hypothetical protein
VRKAVVVTLLALSLSLPAAPALATAHSPEAPSVSKTKPAKPGKSRFVAGGRLTSVDAAAGTLTFRVRGGKDKALRDQLVTVTVPSTAVVRRDGAVVDLGDLTAGDHVHVSGRRADSGYVVNRVSVESRVVPAPAPSETEAPEPAETPAPAPSQTAAPVV